MNRNNTWLMALIWIMVVVGVLASTATLVVTNTGFGRQFVTGEQADMIERYARLDLICEKLEESYYREVDSDALVEGAIRGMMASLDDPYTFYYSADELSAHNRNLGDAYPGIGVILQSNAEGGIEVMRVYADSPAEKSGVRVGDRIVQIDGTPVSAVNAQRFDEAVHMLTGEVGTTVAVTLQRGAERVEVCIEHAEVRMDNVSSTVLEDGIGYIEIDQFTGNDVEGFQSALERLQEAQVSALLIDLRNNPGGLLEDVRTIADLLLPEGIVVYTQNREGKRTDYYSDAEFCDLPLCVLVNGMSASASEILAAAVQDSGRGSVVGTQTYGKGIVQSLLTFESDGAGMQYTSERYFTPAGKCIDGIGVTPDVIVEQEIGGSFGADHLDPENDAQLRAAIRILKGE